MRREPSFASAVALIVAFANVAMAQETGGNLRGRLVASGGGAFVADAHISATGPNLQGARTTLSRRDGTFQLLALPAGSYQLRIVRIGYRPLVVQHVVVQLGLTTGLANLTLEPLGVELGEVRIIAPRLSLDPVNTSVGATLKAQEFATLPSERDYKSLLAIVPHINTSYRGDAVNAAGSTGLENVYFIDGVNVTSPLAAKSGTSLPYNFVRAVEVKAGGHEAQYGRALGALVNAVTYSGTNDHEANVFGFATHDALAADAKVQPGLRETRSVSYDVGARLSGPIERDRLWYSAAYNPRVDETEKEIPGHGLFTDRLTAHVFAGKLTWRASSRWSMELSVFGDPTVRHEVRQPGLAPQGATVINPDPYLIRSETGGVIASLRSALDLSQRVRVDAALSRSSGRSSQLGDTDIGRSQALFVDEVSRAIGGGMLLETEVHEGRDAAMLRGTLSLGTHTLVAGAEYEDARVWQRLATPDLGLILRQEPNLYTVEFNAAEGTFHNRAPTAYVQDSWRIGGRLTLNLGLRWSSQFLSGAHGPTYQTLPNEWQPRAGFSLQLGRHGTQRLFGSYGRYYQQEPLNLAALFYVDFYFRLRTYSADPRRPGATLIDDTGETAPNYEKEVSSVHGIDAEHLDEFTLGYERLFGSSARLTLRGIQRKLRSSFQWGFLPDSPYFAIGTPGKGLFDFLPAPRREYTAAELALDGGTGRMAYRASYVISRAWGNYSGLFASDFGSANPGGNFTFATPLHARNTTGRLPNDIPHIVKFAGAYGPAFGLTVGAFLVWQSGAPLNEFRAAAPFGARTPELLVPRGSVGRTPSISNLDVRVAYARSWPIKGSRLLLDVFHVGNPRRPVWLQEMHYRARDANGVPIADPQYLRPRAFQPPMSARLAFEMNF